MNWIDEAEKKHLDSNKAQERTERIQIINFQENSKQFHSFVDDLAKLIHRINKLSYDERKPSLDLGFTEIEDGKCYEYYGSAYVYKKSFFSFLTGSHYRVLCWHRINFKIADEFNIVKVHINESYTEKDKGLLVSTGEKKEKYKLRINGFNAELLLTTINWLTFKCEHHNFKKSLPFAHTNGHHQH